MADKGPKFTLDKDTITYSGKEGNITGKVVKNESGYAVHLTSQHNLSDDKKLALERRMRNWFYYTTIKK